MGQNEIKLILDLKNMIVKIKKFIIGLNKVDIVKSKLMNWKIELRDFVECIFKLKKVESMKSRMMQTIF